MPFLIALAASLTLHVAVLVSPGWSLPFDEDHDGPPLDAVLVPPPRPVAQAVQAPAAPPPPRKRANAKPATPTVPAAAVPGSMPVPAAEQAVQEPAPVVAEQPPSTQPAVPPASTIATQWPRQGRIVFQVTRGEGGFIVGRSEHSWSHDGASYTLRAVTETVGLAALFRPVTVEQESRGTLAAAGLQPVEFTNKRDGKLKESVQFDGTQGRIVFGSGGSAAYVEAQDLLSLFYQLGGTSFATPQFVVTVALARRLAGYQVSVEEPAPLETPLGARQAWHLKVIAAKGSGADDSTEIWLDAQSRLPLRIRHRDRTGEVYDQIATLVEVDKPQ